jgi:hypothetical protein
LKKIKTTTEKSSGVAQGAVPEFQKKKKIEALSF